VFCLQVKQCSSGNKHFRINAFSDQQSALSKILKKQPGKIIRVVSAWLSLILAGRPWPACEASAANHRRGDSFGGQNRCEPSPNIQ
jgi:hypothetical protein